MSSFGAGRMFTPVSTLHPQRGSKRHPKNAAEDKHHHNSLEPGRETNLKIFLNICRQDKNRLVVLLLFSYTPVHLTIIKLNPAQLFLSGVFFCLFPLRLYFT